MAAMMTGTRTKTAARHLVEQLAAWGCRTVYGVAGDENLYLLDALAGQDAIQYVACRLETTAALMASAEAKLTGRLTACTAGAGPGAALLTAGLGDAALDRAPVLAITGQVERKKIGTGAKQAVDQQLLVQPFARDDHDPGRCRCSSPVMRTALEEERRHHPFPRMWTQQVDSRSFLRAEAQPHVGRRKWKGRSGDGRGEAADHPGGKGNGGTGGAWRWRSGLRRPSR